MKRLLGGVLGFVVGVVMVCGVVHAGPPVSSTVSWDAGDALVVDKSSIANYKMQVGTRLLGVIGMSGATTSGICMTALTGVNHSLCNAISTTETSMVTLKTTGAIGSESISLANGQPGQIKTYVLVTDGGTDFYVTPVTKTGFTSIQLNDAKDSCTLRFVNSTVGWVVSGNNACTVN